MFLTDDMGPIHHLENYPASYLTFPAKYKFDI